MLSNTARDVPAPPRRTYTTISTSIPLSTPVYRCKQLAEPTSITASNSAVVTGAYSFTLSNLDQSASFQAIFDEYRIEAVRFTIYPTSNALQVPTTSTTAFTQLYNIIDYNGGSTPNTAALCREKESCVILQPGESCSRVFKPQPQTSSGIIQPDSQWSRTTTLDLTWYGTTIFVPQVTAAQTLLQVWNIEVEYFLAFRNLI